MAEQIITKRCWKCKEIKPLSEYHKAKRYKDGHNNLCKICNLEQSSINAKTPKRKASLKQYERTKIGKKVRSKIGKRFRGRFPERSKAKDAVNHAVAAGILPKIKTLQCYLCFKPAQEYHHYLGYEPKHWLDVLPACIKCHNKIHSSNLHLRQYPKSKIAQS